MSKKMMRNGTLSTYCLNLNMLISAGVGVEEASSVLCDDEKDEAVRELAVSVHEKVEETGSLAKAVEQSDIVPVYMQQMIAAGEESGRLEDVLMSLSNYYAQQEEMQNRIRSAVMYPTVMLLVMSGILLFMLLRVLPVFSEVYTNLTGVTSTSLNYLSVAMVLGWIAFGVTFAIGACILVMFGLWNHGKCHKGILKMLSSMHLTKNAVESNATAQFTAAFATYVASGVDTDTAMDKSRTVVSNRFIREKLDRCTEEMSKGRSFIQTVKKEKIYSPLYTSLLVSGEETGSLDSALQSLSKKVSDTSKENIASLTDAIEPALASILTICIGVLLVAVMLPLIGIMGSIG